MLEAIFLPKTHCISTKNDVRKSQNSQPNHHLGSAKLPKTLSENHKTLSLNLKSLNQSS